MNYQRPGAGLDGWATGGDTPPLPLEYFDDIHISLDARDFVQGVLVEQSSIVVYGESNSGKTFWVTDLALCIAAGIPWNGRRVEQGGVIYCVLEGGHGFRNRVAAWKAQHDTLTGPVYFAAIPASINLLDPDADTENLIDAIHRAAEHMGIPVKLVVIDTLARAMAGGNENAPEDMGALVGNMDRIRTATKSAVKFIHHSGKDAAKGARGHSSLRAAIDTEIEVTVGEDGQTRAATIVKQREMKKGDVFAFSLDVCEIGLNRHGEAVTTCLVKHEEVSSETTTRHKALSGHAQRALEVLTTIIAGQGETGVHGLPSGSVSVHSTWWRTAFYEKSMPGSTQETKQKAFVRASGDLINTHRVGMSNDRVWIIYRNKEGGN